MVKVLFICMGNICRSPMAEGVLRRMLVDAGIDHAVAVDSAGTHGYHVGLPPDRRSIETARRRGVDLEPLRARQVTIEDLYGYDYVLAMDQDNYRHLVDMCPIPAQRRKIGLFLQFAPEIDEREVPDPYYGPDGSFERVMDLIERGMTGLLLHVRRRHRL